jgi:PAS domain S-box-containing protein
MLTSVLACSAVLQLTAAVMAYRLIRLSGKRTAWSLIAIALVLMSIRRVIPLYHLLSGDSAFAPDLLNEIIGLVLSALMVLGVAGITPLFSAIKRSHEALRKSEELYRAVFENTGTATVLIEENTVISHANTEFEKLSKCSRQEIEGEKSWTDFVVKEDLDRMRSQHFLRREKREAAQKQYEFRFITNDGDIRNIFLSIDVIPGTKRSIASLLDITDRIRAEDSLRESERKLREAQEMAHLGYWYWDVKTGNVEWSEEVFRIFRLDPETFTPQIDSVLALSPWPEDHKRDKELISRAIENHEPGSYEQKFLRPDGSIGHYYSTFQGNYDGQGDLFSIVGTVLDITERKLAEEALRESEEKFRGIFENSTVGKSLTAPYGKLLRVNRAFADMLGYTVDELQEVNFAEITHPDDIAASRECIRCLLAGERDFYRMEKRYLSKDGGIVWADESTRLYRNVNGNPQYLITCLVNITDRRRAEQALIASEVRYRRLFESAKDGILILDAETGMVVDVNPFLIEMLGYSHEQFLGKTIWEVGFLSDTVANKYNFRKLQREKYVRYDDLPLETTDGRRIDVEFVSNVYDVGGATVIQCNIRNVTERKQAEEQIKSLARFPEENPNPVLRIAQNGTILYANPASDDLKRQTTLFVDGVASPWLQDLLENAFDSGSVIRTETAFNGSVYQLTIRSFTEKEYANIYARDITDRKRVEEALRESEQKLKAAVYGSPIPQFVIDRDHRVVYWNKALEETTGRKAEEMVGTDNHWLAFYKEKRPCMCDLLVDGHTGSIPEWYGARCRESLLVANAFEVTNFFPDLGDGGKWLFFTAVPITDSEGNVIGAMETLEDVTGRIKAETEIHQLNEELEQRVIDRTAQLQAANKELEAFSYSVSHDLRAPLRALDGFSRILIEDYAAQLPDEAVEHLNRVRNGATQMGHLIDDLLRFSRLSRQPLEKQLVNLSALVEEIWNALESERKGRRVEFVIGKLPDCQGDSALLKQVFLNLLGNALKYSRLRADARIEIGFLPQVIRAGGPLATNVYFVKDNGVGFDMQFAGKLFGVFQRLHRQDEYEGTGVGLAIVHRVVVRHGGRIWAESEPDKGATFYLTIGDAQVPTVLTGEKAMV